METATGNLIAAAIGAKGVDVEVAAAATAEIARQKPRVEERIGLKDAFEEVLLTSARRYYLLRPVGSGSRLFLLLVLDRTQANLSGRAARARRHRAGADREIIGSESRGCEKKGDRRSACPGQRRRRRAARSPKRKRGAGARCLEQASKHFSDLRSEPGDRRVLYWGATTITF